MPWREHSGILPAAVTRYADHCRDQRATSVKNQDRLSLLRRFTPPARGRYECTVPSCGVKTKEDGYCPTHGVPLRLVKAKR